MTTFEFRIQDKIKYSYKGKLKILSKKNLNLILNFIANEILNKVANKNGYVNIKNTAFRSKLYRYEPYLSYLLFKGLVERDYYKENEKPFGYRFSEIFKEKIEISKIYYVPGVKNTQWDVQKYHPDMRINQQVFERLKKDFTNANVIYNPAKEQIEKTKDEWGNFIVIQKWLDNNRKLKIWKNKHVTFKWSKNRLYTNFVNLSSHVRSNNIQLNNEKIIEFDIVSSFPLMLAQYCLKHIPEIRTDADFKSYCTSVIEGKFYSELMLGLNSIRNTTKGNHESDYSKRLLSRNEAKTLFQIYLNGNKNKMQYLNGLSTDVNKYMELRYPYIHELVNKIKDDGRLPYDELVKIETKLIFDIIEELYDTYADIRILTCHDAIYVPISFEDRTRIIWDKHLNHIKSNLPMETYGIDDNSSLESMGIFCDNDGLDDENGWL